MDKIDLMVDDDQGRREGGFLEMGGAVMRSLPKHFSV